MPGGRSPFAVKCGSMLRLVMRSAGKITSRATLSSEQARLALASLLSRCVPWDATVRSLDLVANGVCKRHFCDLARICGSPVTTDSCCLPRIDRNNVADRQSVEEVGPVLHHLASLVHLIGVVVARPSFISLNMCKLKLDRLRSPALLI